MNKEKLTRSMDQLKGEAKVQWCKLTDDHLKIIEGKVKQGVGEVKDDLSK